MTRTRRLWIVLAANLALVGALVAVGLTAHSIGVWAEAVDYLADAAGIAVTLLTIRLQAPTPTRPDGRPNATRYAALINAGWLLALSLAVVAGSVDRLATGIPDVHGLPVLLTSGVATAVMAAGALLLGGDIDDEGDDDGSELGVRAVLLDTAADAATAAGVATAGAVIYGTGRLHWLDPAIALTIALVIAFHAIKLLARVQASLRT